PPTSTLFPYTTLFRSNKFRAQQCKKERHHDVAKNQPRKIVAKVCFGPPKHGHFIMDAMHKMPVPNESKHKEKNKGCDECDEEFLDRKSTRLNSSHVSI